MLLLNLPNDSENSRTLKNYVPAGYYASAVVEKGITIPISLDSPSEPLKIQLKLKDDINVLGDLYKFNLTELKITLHLRYLF